jgi:cytochrome P450
VVWLAWDAAGRENGGDEIAKAGDGKILRQRRWAFGSGIHRCLGMHLAGIEIAALVTEWFSRIPQFQLEPGFAPAIRHLPNGVTHLGGLMLRWADFH